QITRVVVVLRAEYGLTDLTFDPLGGRALTEHVHGVPAALGQLGQRRRRTCRAEFPQPVLQFLVVFHRYSSHATSGAHDQEQHEQRRDRTLHSATPVVVATVVTRAPAGVRASNVAAFLFRRRIIGSPGLPLSDVIA